MAQLPSKLKKDAIIEALVELRFDTEEAPEIVLGRLTDNPKWADFKRTRTAIAELPSVIRLSDPNLRFQPHFDLRGGGGKWNIKVGTNVLSIHNLEEYVGWHKFSSDVSALVHFLFDRLGEVAVRRIGVRYINALNATDHLIKSIQDLNLEMKVSGNPLVHHVNLNYRIEFDIGQAMVRIASPDLVEGTIRPGMTAYVDVDVFTHNSFSVSQREAVLRWVDLAHTEEKTVFFGLIPDDVVEKIKES